MSSVFARSSFRLFVSTICSASFRWVASTIFSCFRSPPDCSSSTSARLSTARSRSCSSSRILDSSRSPSAFCVRAFSLISSSASRRPFSISRFAFSIISFDSVSASFLRSRSSILTRTAANTAETTAVTIMCTGFTDMSFADLICAMCEGPRDKAMSRPPRASRSSAAARDRFEKRGIERLRWPLVPKSTRRIYFTVDSDIRPLAVEDTATKTSAARRQYGSP